MVKKNTLSKNQLLAVLESTPNMIWRANLNAKCDYFNKTWLNFTGRTMLQESNDGWAEGVHPDDFDYCLKIFLGAFNKREPFIMDYRLRRNDGQFRWIEDTGTPYYNEGGEFLGYIGSCIDATDRIEAEQVKDMALKDALTGLVNRAYFEKLFNLEFENAKRFKRNLSLIMLDADKFKSINDSRGHVAGDMVLQCLSSILNLTVRHEDIVSRYGGDEFILILPKTNIDTALEIAERIRMAVEKNTLAIDKLAIQFTTSIGVVQYSNENNPLELLEKADKAMYRSKHSGGNTVSRM
ncbi:MAG: sensor domain-containing diguanylate cyclase [Actinomycetota bacterium]